MRFNKRNLLSISLAILALALIISVSGEADTYFPFIFILDGMLIILLTLTYLQIKKVANASKEHGAEKFKGIYMSNIIGLAFSTIDGYIFDANNYFMQMLGYSAQDIHSGKLSWSGITPPEFQEASRKALEQIQKQKIVTPFEKEYFKKNGQRTAAIVGAAPFRFNNEDYIVTFILDISERKEIEQQLARAYAELEERVAQRTKDLSEANKTLLAMIEASAKKTDQIQESQNFLDSVVENIPNMIFIKDAHDLRFLRLNKAGEELIGLDRHEMIGKNDSDFFPPEQAEAFTSKDRQVLSEGKVQDIPEEPIQTKNGIRYLHTKKIPIFDKNNVPAYLLGISEDITDKKIAEAQRIRLIQEQAAREEAEHGLQRLTFLAEAGRSLSSSLNYKETMQSFSKIVISHMADGCLIYMLNEDDQPENVITNFRDPLKTSAVINMRVLYPINWDAQTGPAHVIRSGLPEIIPVITDAVLRISAYDDKHFQMIKGLGLKSAMTVPLKSFNKTLGAISFVTTTASNRIYTDFDLSIAEDLAKRASIAIENARLYSKVQEASHAKTAFLANMSHEIRTPLGAMLGFAELMQDPKIAPEEQKNCIETVIRNGKQLLRIVNEILDISKVESERLNIEKIKFSLPELIQDVAELLRFQAEEKGLKFKMESSSLLPLFIVSDPTRLRQILINIIGNAIKFTEKGAIEIKITHSETKGTGKTITLFFAVHDSGIGITEEQEKRLFQPFSQGDSSTTRKFGGTGLGLYLSKKLAHALGGDLVLVRKKDRVGSTFLCTIQAEIVNAQEFLQMQKKQDEKNTTAPLSIHPLKVLVVDDSPDNRALVGRFIVKMGFDADSAVDGFEGVKKALSHNYDVVLMDIQMPDMDGFQAVEKLRALNYRKPIIALTAHAMKGDREKCIEKGFDNYLVKPINKEHLQKVLLQYVNSRPPPDLQY